jgi:pyridinium-3,5-biscarboxylic acid mononucleotide synthase
MDPQRLRDLLERVARKETTPEQAIGALASLPFEDLGFAKIDHHRQLRTGAPEIVFGEGKTAEQIARIVDSIRAAGQTGIVTRVDAVKAEAAIELMGPTVAPHARHDTKARILVVGPAMEKVGRGKIAVVAAGTSDRPVAEEAARTAELLGNDVERIDDVGVAGLHRVIAVRGQLEAAEVVVVVAGMEGALPSVVRGLISRPVIAVPTSVGFGASFHGLAALLAMLNACAPGVTVVNIDNGFGAGYAAALINRKRD